MHCLSAIVDVRDLQARLISTMEDHLLLKLMIHTVGFSCDPKQHIAHSTFRMPTDRLEQGQWDWAQQASEDEIAGLGGSAPRGRSTKCAAARPRMMATK